MAEAATRAMRGTVVAMTGQLLTQALRFASNIIMARLVSEVAFGQHALVMTITTGLWLVSDLGLGHSLVRHTRDDDTFVHTAWTMGVVRAVLLLVAGGVLAPIVAAFYDEPLLLWLLPLCALRIFFQAAESSQFYLATRRVRVERVVALEVTAQVSSIAVAVSVGYATHHVVALVAAAVVSAFVRTTLTHLVLGARMRFVWDRAARHELLAFGKWVFLSTLFAFVAMRWDVFSIGRLQGFAVLGVYGLAIQVTSVPSQMATQFCAMVLGPVLAEAWRDGPSTLSARLREARAGYVPMALLLFLGAATLAPLFFKLAYKDRFVDGGGMAQLLMLTVFATFIQEATSRALVAAGDGRGLAVTNASKVGVTIVATLIGFTQFGFVGFLVGNGVGALAGVVIIGLRARGLGLHDALRADLQTLALFLLLVALSCGVPWLLSPVVHVDVAMLTAAACPLVCVPLLVRVLRRARQLRQARAEVAG
jgi:O-antigen/teichoic acid export membrane protein